MSKAHHKVAESTLRHPGGFMAGAALVILLFWIGFTATLKWQELVVGGCAAVLTLILFFHLLRTQELRFRLQMKDLLLVRKVPAAIVKDCWVLTVVLLQDLAGERAGSFYRACGFRISTHDPVLVGRTALAIAYTTASPNMIVIGVDSAQSLMLFHQLKRDAVPASTQALGAAGQHEVPRQRSAGAA